MIDGFFLSLDAEKFVLVGRYMLSCVYFLVDGGYLSTEFEPPTRGNCYSIFSNFSRIYLAILTLGTAYFVAGDEDGPFLENLPASPLFFKDGRLPAGDLEAIF